MALTVEVKEANGETPTWTTISSVIFCTADVYNPGTNYPIPIPNSGFRYSYWKTLTLEFTGIDTKVSNIRFYTDGAIGWNFGTGGALLVGTKDSGDSGLPLDSYDQATGTEGTTGDYMGDATNGHSTYKQDGYTIKDASQYIATSPLLIDSNEYTTDGKCKAVVLQVKLDTLDNGAQEGTQTEETLYWRYDAI